MGQILKGTKVAFKLADVKPVKVANRTYITVDKVVKQIKYQEAFMKYLPDKPESAGRQFLFNIVNTVEPSYFKLA